MAAPYTDLQANKAIKAHAARLDTLEAQDAGDMDYTPTAGGDWPDPDPSTVEGALDDLASRAKALEDADAALEAGDVAFTPTTAGDWDDPDPTDVGGALDDAAGRIKVLEEATTAAGDVSYTPTTAGDWDDPDPTDVGGALDDAAGRLKVLEDATTAAGDVGYTPTTAGDWDDPDPTDVGGALDDAAGRIKVLEDATTAASDVDYTPANAGDWDDPDPTKVDGALDDIAGRVKTLEGVSSGVSGAAHLTCSADTDPAPTGATVNFDDLTQTPGFGVSVTSGTVTLPAGAWYELQCNSGGRLTGSAGYFDFAFKDVTGGGDVQVGQRWQWYRPDATFASGVGDNGYALIDATAGARDIEVQVLGQSAEDFVADEMTLMIRRAY